MTPNIIIANPGLFVFPGFGPLVLLAAPEPVGRIELELGRDAPAGLGSAAQVLPGIEFARAVEPDVLVEGVAQLELVDEVGAVLDLVDGGLVADAEARAERALEQDGLADQGVDGRGNAAAQVRAPAGGVRVLGYLDLVHEAGALEDGAGERRSELAVEQAGHAGAGLDVAVLRGQAFE